MAKHRVAKQAVAARKPGRNDACPCGSGRKYKVCCGKATAQPVHPDAGNASVLQAIQRLSAQASRALQSGRIQEALTCLDQAVSMDPQNISLQLDLGRLLLNIGRPADALICMQRARSIDPDHVQARMLEGIARENLGWIEEAEAIYREVITRMPRLAAAYSRLGTVLLLQDQQIEAAECFRRVARLEPGKVEGLLGRALALVAERKPEAARTALKDVLKRDPENLTALSQLGKLLAEAGKADEAWSTYSRLLEISPNSAGQYYDLVRIRSLTESDRPLLERMQHRLAQDGIHPIQRVMLELAIGKAFDDLSDPEQAMGHYLAANRLKGKIRPLDRDMIRRRVDWLIQTFTPDVVSSDRMHAYDQDSTPIVVLGMPRSGTTLVERILGNHSRVGTGEELSFWSRTGRRIESSGQLPDQASMAGLAQSYIDVLRAISDAPHVTDKKPDNFFWAGLIHLVFPKAHIIHCSRHPLDTCVSIIGNFFAPRPDFSTEPSDLVFYYSEYTRLMDHWRSVLPGRRFLEVNYEELVTTPEPVIQRLLSFCDLPWEEACLYPERNERQVTTASLWQVRNPIFRGSIDRWRRYEPWLEEFSTLQSI